MNSAIYQGMTTHVRSKPFEHRLQYGLFSLLVDLDELDDLERIRLFSYNRPGIVSFFDKDHGPRDGSALRSWISGQLLAAGIDEEVGRVRLLCLPRIAGYEFNPLTVWFIDGSGGLPRWILYEIHNTFGEAHSHLVEVDEPDRHRHTFSKEFYVSPFFDVEGSYKVQVSQPGERLSISIAYQVEEETVFTAVLAGQRVPMTSKTLLRALIRYPLVTIKVMAAIHWEASILWFKGARYRKRPQAPSNSVSISTRISG